MNSTEQTTRWLSPTEAKLHMPPKAWALISHNNSLTKKLKDITNSEMEFHFLNADWGQAYPDEAKKIGLSATEATWIRHIEMRYQNTLWTIGRVLIPKTSLQAGDLDFTNLGAQSIGDVLFQDTNLKRSAFEFLQLPDGHPYLEHFKIAHDNTNADIWARRSVIYFHQKPLLIVELFLPAALNPNNYDK